MIQFHEDLQLFDDIDLETLELMETINSIEEADRATLVCVLG